VASALAIAFSAEKASAQPVVNTRIGINYAYAASLGFGGYSVAETTANVYTLPLSFTLPNLPREGWGVKLLAPIQVGVYNFDATIFDRHISINQQSVALVPGAELQIPVTDRFMLKPFAQGGVGRAFGEQVGSNPNAWIYLAGVRSIAQWRAGDYTLSLGNGVVFAGDRDMGPGDAEDYISLQIAAEVRRPLGFTIGNFAPDLGVFVANYYYPKALRFDRVFKEPLRISNQNEIGFSIGSAEPWSFLGFSNPRLGAGVVFGGGLVVYHINFGFPF
jgi:hypothetical protein